MRSLKRLSKGEGRVVAARRNNWCCFQQCKQALYYSNSLQQYVCTSFCLNHRLSSDHAAGGQKLLLGACVLSALLLFRPALENICCCRLLILQLHSSGGKTTRTVNFQQQTISFFKSIVTRHIPSAFQPLIP